MLVGSCHVKEWHQYNNGEECAKIGLMLVHFSRHDPASMKVGIWIGYG